MSMIRIFVCVIVSLVVGLLAFYILNLNITVCFAAGGISGGTAMGLFNLVRAAQRVGSPY